MEDQTRGRARIHRIIVKMVPWKAAIDELILHKARYEITRSLARHPVLEGRNQRWVDPGHRKPQPPARRAGWAS